MRLIGAGCFVFAGMLAGVGILSASGLLRALPPWAGGASIALVMLALVPVALWLFGPKGSDRLGRKTAEEHLRELEDLGLLESQAFRAVRAFAVEEWEDEGLHYFLELVDGGVLYLSGQYLYDFEPTEEGEVPAQARRFPCTEFVVRRHKREGYVADMECQGAVLEPELTSPPFTRDDWRKGHVPEDGAIIRTASYLELKERGGRWLTMQ